MTTLTEARKAILLRRMRRYVYGDSLCFSDDFLLEMVLGERQLTPGEQSLLYESPMTLRRLHAIELAFKRERSHEPTSAANDALWQGSRGLLRAAAGGGEAATLATDDGYWTLDFPRAQDGWWIVLRLDPAAPFAGEFLGADGKHEAAEVAVVDGSGRTLLIGALDEDGKLLARWPDAEAPLKVLSAAGGGFQVLRV